MRRQAVDQDVHPMRDVAVAGQHGVCSEFNAGKYVPYVGDEVRIDIALEAMVP